jgi:cytochrome P450
MSREAEILASQFPVKPFPLWGMLQPGIDPYTLVHSVRDEAEIFYAPNSHNSQAGSWVITRHPHFKEIYNDPLSFSAENQTGIAALLGAPLRMVPTEADSPDHAGFRAILAPVFAPSRLNALEPKLERISKGLLAVFADQGHCEFMQDYAQRFPIGVFLGLMGLPLDDIDMLNDWTKALTYSPDLAIKRKSIQSIVAYLADKIHQAEQQPAESIISLVVKAEFQGRRLTDEEKMALCFNIFVGGMDTIAAALGWQFRYLALNPAVQKSLRDDRSSIPAAIEELLRAFSIVNTTRTALKDLDFHGVTIKAGDFVTLATQLANRDPQIFPEPARLELDRTPNRHLAFGYGMHHCLGASLARRELRMAMESWFDTLPMFALKGAPEDGLPSYAGNMLSLQSLQIGWD